MKAKTLIAFLLSSICLLSNAQNADTRSYLGYVYPAGGQTGTSFEAIVGGRYLRQAQAATLNGLGIQVEILKHYRMVRAINGTQRTVLSMQIAQREYELKDVVIPQKLQKSYDKLTSAEIEKERIPEHPLFDDIGTKTLAEIKHLKTVLAAYNSRQANDQIGEQLKIRITIARDADPGMRELRVLSHQGLSNPIRFQISKLSERSELEPNDRLQINSSNSLIEKLPCVINGQITQGDVDRFVVEAKAGQTMKFDLLARRLIPYLADAVPGWFQSTLSIYDKGDKRLLFIDDTYGNPDPTTEFTFPDSGNYIVEIHDALYRGCENFIYRLHISNPGTDTTPLRQSDVNYMSRDLPYHREIEPNGSLKDAQPVTLPTVISGIIQKKGDIDLFQFSGKQGETIVVETEARRFDSPIDSIVRIISKNGDILAFNDDYMEKRQHLHLGPGLQTHYADSYLSYTLPDTDTYLVSVEDVQRHGGNDYKYRLRLSTPMPSFELRLRPSSLNIRSSGCSDFQVYLNRTDGFTGPVTLRLVNAPEGAQLHNAIIPAGESEIWATLEWPVREKNRIEAVQIEAVANASGHEIKKNVIPCDNNMQAFLWRHLLPAQELNIAALAHYRTFSYETEHEPSGIILHKNNRCSYQQPLQNLPKNPERYQFRIKEAPEGVELIQAEIKGKNIQMQFLYNETLPNQPKHGNLLVEVIRKEIHKKTKRTQTTLIGVLPAIAYELSLK